MLVDDAGSVPSGSDRESSKEASGASGEETEVRKGGPNEEEDESREKPAGPDTAAEFSKDTGNWKKQAEKEEGEEAKEDEDEEDSTSDDQTDNGLENQEASEDEELAFEDKVDSDIEDLAEEAGVRADEYDVDAETSMKPIVQEAPVEEDPPIKPEDEWYYKDMERREYQLAELLQCSLYEKTAEEVRESKARVHSHTGRYTFIPSPFEELPHRMADLMVFRHFSL